jgi:hypothetical protein
MTRQVALVDDYLFRDGRTAFFKSNQPFSTVTKAVEVQATRRIRQRVRKLLPSIAADIAATVGKRTGEARNAILFGNKRITGATFNTLRVRILGPDYVKLLDEGGIIKPKGRFLAIPIDYGLKKDGSAKLPGPRSWKNITKTFTFKGKKSGNIFIAMRRTEGGKRVQRLLYVLVKQVRVTGRDRIASVYARRRGDIEQIVSQEIQQAFFDYVDAPRQRLLPKARLTTGGRGRR